MHDASFFALLIDRFGRLVFDYQGISTAATYAVPAMIQRSKLPPKRGKKIVPLTDDLISEGLL